MNLIIVCALFVQDTETAPSDDQQQGLTGLIPSIKRQPRCNTNKVLHCIVFLRVTSVFSPNIALQFIH